MNSLFVAVISLAVITTTTGAKLPTKKRGLEELLGYPQLLDTSFGPTNSYGLELKELASPLNGNSLNTLETGFQDYSLDLGNAGGIALPYNSYGNQQIVAPQLPPAVQQPSAVSVPLVATATTARPIVAVTQPPQPQSQPREQAVAAPTNPIATSSAPAPLQAAVSAQPSISVPAVASATIQLQVPAQLQQLQTFQTPAVQSIAQSVNTQQAQSVQSSGQSQQAQPVASAAAPVNPKQVQLLQVAAPSNQAAPAAISTPVANSQSNQIAQNVQYLPLNQAPIPQQSIMTFPQPNSYAQANSAIQQGITQGLTYQNSQNVQNLQLNQAHGGLQQSIISFPGVNPYTQQQLYYKYTDAQIFPFNQHLDGLQQLGINDQKALLDTEGYGLNANSAFSGLKVYEGTYLLH